MQEAAQKSKLVSFELFYCGIRPVVVPLSLSLGWGVAASVCMGVLRQQLVICKCSLRVGVRLGHLAGVAACPPSGSMSHPKINGNPWKEITVFFVRSCFPNTLSFSSFPVLFLFAYTLAVLNQESFSLCFLSKYLLWVSRDAFKWIFIHFGRASASGVCLTITVFPSRNDGGQMFSKEDKSQLCFHFLFLLCSSDFISSHHPQWVWSWES